MRRLWKLLVGAAAVIVLAGCLGPGTYTVGFGDGQAAPGLWHTWTNASCYWERLSGFSGQSSDIIANGFEPTDQGPVYVQVKPTDAGFHTEFCSFRYVGSDKDMQFVEVNNEIAPGDYRVGPEIYGGVYQAKSAGPDCYWARLRGFSGESSDIIANDFAGSTIVTIQPTDFGFQSRNCGVWTKIG